MDHNSQLAHCIPSINLNIAIGKIRSYVLGEEVWEFMYEIRLNQSVINCFFLKHIQIPICYLTLWSVVKKENMFTKLFYLILIN